MQRDEYLKKIIVSVLGQDKIKDRRILPTPIRPGFHFFQKILHLLRTTKSRSHPGHQDAQASDSERPSAATNEEGRNRRKIIVAVVGVKLQQSGAVETKDDSKNGNKLVSLHWTPLSGKALDKASGMQARSRMLRPRSPKVVTFRS
jgi:hypothetical protein